MWIYAIFLSFNEPSSIQTISNRVRAELEPNTLIARIELVFLTNTFLCSSSSSSFGRNEPSRALNESSSILFANSSVRLQPYWKPYVVSCCTRKSVFFLGTDSSRKCFFYQQCFLHNLNLYIREG